MNAKVRHFPLLGVTLASEPVNEYMVTVAVAVTHDNDQYERRMGRTIAEGRLRANRNRCAQVRAADLEGVVREARAAEFIGGLRACKRARNRLIGLTAPTDVVE